MLDKYYSCKLRIFWDITVQMIEFIIMGYFTWHDINFRKPNMHVSIIFSKFDPEAFSIKWGTKNFLLEKYSISSNYRCSNNICIMRLKINCYELYYPSVFPYSAPLFMILSENKLFLDSFASSIPTYPRLIPGHSIFGPLLYIRTMVDYL
jgi:hypothetical protein